MRPRRLMVFAVALSLTMVGCTNAIKHDKALPGCDEMRGIAAHGGMPEPVADPGSPSPTSTEVSCVITIGDSVPKPSASPDGIGPQTRDQGMSRVVVHLIRPDKDPFRGRPVKQWVVDTLAQVQDCPAGATGHDTEALARGRICLQPDPPASANATISGYEHDTIITIAITYQNPLLGVDTAARYAETESLAFHSDLSDLLGGIPRADLLRAIPQRARSLRGVRAFA